MKHSILIIFSSLLLFQACNKIGDEMNFPLCEGCEFTCIDEGNILEIWDNNCKDNWTCEYEVLSNSRVDAEDSSGLIEGDRTVFKLTASTEGEIAIADDEYTAILIFEINSSQESFSVEDTELSNLNVFHKFICYCLDVEFKPAVSGCLEGLRQDNGSWFVQGNLIFDDVNFSTPLEVLVDAEFRE